MLFTEENEMIAASKAAGLTGPPQAITLDSVSSVSAVAEAEASDVLDEYPQLVLFEEEIGLPF